MGVEYEELKEFEKRLQNIANEKKLNAFFEDCIKELALRFLAEAIRLTPVAQSRKVTRKLKDEDGNYIIYKKGAREGKIKTKVYTTHTGGTLRRGWVVNTHSEAEANKRRPSVTDIKGFLKNIKVVNTGNKFTIKLINPVEYAIYVNYGHRTRNGGFVDGRFFLEKAEHYINENKDKFLEKKLNYYIGSALNDS